MDLGRSSVAGGLFELFSAARDGNELAPPRSIRWQRWIALKVDEIDAALRLVLSGLAEQGRPWIGARARQAVQQLVEGKFRAPLGREARKPVLPGPVTQGASHPHQDVGIVREPIRSHGAMQERNGNMVNLSRVR